MKLPRIGRGVDVSVSALVCSLRGVCRGDADVSVCARSIRASQGVVGTFWSK